MAAALLPDALWDLIHPLSPIPPVDQEADGRESRIARV
jgi:hypothetical protein